MLYIHAVVVSVVVPPVQSDALVVVDVFEAVIGVATPIWRPLDGAIGATRDITGSLFTKEYLIKKWLKYKIIWKTNCVIGAANACGRPVFDVTSSDCLLVVELIVLDDVDGYNDKIWYFDKNFTGKKSLYFICY